MGDPPPCTVWRLRPSDLCQQPPSRVELNCALPELSLPSPARPVPLLAPWAQTCAGGHGLELLHQRIQKLPGLQPAPASPPAAAGRRCRVEEAQVRGQRFAQAAVERLNLLLLLALQL